MTSTDKKVSTKVVNSVSETIIPKEAVAKTKKVCIDPGHGGNDLGASYKKINESDINLEVALTTKTLLENKGYEVILTRSDNSFVEKKDRAFFCNDKNADILVSIHHNSYTTDHSVDYSTVLYYKASDQLLADSILNSVSNRLGSENQGVSKFNNSLFWTAQMPSALSEAFFLTSTERYNTLTYNKKNFLEKEAEGLTNGITNYFENPNDIPQPKNNNSLIVDRIDLN